MARQARKVSGSGIYHIMMRGINQQTIFEDGEDEDKYLELLKRYTGDGSDVTVPSVTFLLTSGWH